MVDAQKCLFHRKVYCVNTKQQTTEYQISFRFLSVGTLFPSFFLVRSLFSNSLLYNLNLYYRMTFMKSILISNGIDSWFCVRSNFVNNAFANMLVLIYISVMDHSCQKHLFSFMTFTISGCRFSYAGFELFILLFILKSKSWKRI